MLPLSLLIPLTEYFVCCAIAGITAATIAAINNTFFIILSIFACKDSANRTKNQFYLSFSEVQPIFTTHRGTGVV